MSKSDENENATVRILDDKDTIIRKFKRAVTDSDTVVRYAEEKPGVSNLMSIYSCFTGKDFDAIERNSRARATATSSSLSVKPVPMHSRLSAPVSQN